MYEQEYINALEELRFSGEDKARMTQYLLNAEQPRRKRCPLRTALIAAAACAALAVTAAAASPSIREALQGTLGLFAPYAQDIEGAACTDQGIEIRVVSALSDDVRGWVYYTVQDTTENRLDEQLTVKGDMTVMTDTPRDPTGWVSSPAELEYDQLISYDADTKTALFGKRVWFGDDFEPVQDARLDATQITMREGRLGKIQDATAACGSLTGETLESLPATAADTVVFAPSDVEGAPYGNEVLPEEQVVLAPGQNRVPITGNSDIWVSSMGIASDGCFHVRLEFAEGAEVSEYMNAAVFPKDEEDYNEAHFTELMRRVEGGLDILFPMLHAEDVEHLDYVRLVGGYSRPGAVIDGGWSTDFQFVYHASKVLDWTGEAGDHQITQVTVSPLSVTMTIRGESDTGRSWEELSVRLRDGTAVQPKASTCSHMNKGALTGADTDDWEIYNTWEFEEPVEVEDIISLTIKGVDIPVN